MLVLNAKYYDKIINHENAMITKTNHQHMKTPSFNQGYTQRDVTHWFVFYIQSTVSTGPSSGLKLSHLLIYSSAVFMQFWRTCT